MRREPLCKVSYCPEPRNPDWHECIKCGSPYIHHHHANGRGGMGGSKRLRNDKSGIVALCARHHEEAHGIAASTAEGERSPVGSATDSGVQPGHLPSAAGASTREDTGALGRNPPASDTSGTSDGKVCQFCAVAMTPASVPSLEVKP